MSFNNDTSAKLKTLSEFANEFEPETPAAMYKSLRLISNNYILFYYILRMMKTKFRF